MDVITRPYPQKPDFLPGELWEIVLCKFIKIGSLREIWNIWVVLKGSRDLSYNIPQTHIRFVEFVVKFICNNSFKYQWGNVCYYLPRDVMQSDTCLVSYGLFLKDIGTIGKFESHPTIKNYVPDINRILNKFGVELIVKIRQYLLCTSIGMELWRYNCVEEEDGFLSSFETLYDINDIVTKSPSGEWNVCSICHININVWRGEIWIGSSLCTGSDICKLCKI